MTRQGPQDRVLRLSDDQCGDGGQVELRQHDGLAMPGWPGMLKKKQFQPAPAARSSIRHHPMAKQHNGLTSRKRATSLWLGALGQFLCLSGCLRGQ